MTPKNEAERQRAWIKRQEKAGRFRLCVWISEDARVALKEQAKTAGKTQGDYLEGLLRK